jgi:hypothetical protein
MALPNRDREGFPWVCWPTKGHEDARSARTHACRVHTHVNARIFSEHVCSQECEHGTEECARHKRVT